jgi:hypothetical protein
VIHVGGDGFLYEHLHNPHSLLSENTVVFLPIDDDDERNEQWEFPPGSLAECALETREGKEVIIAKRNAQGI